jgi:hypothetical protein
MNRNNWGVLLILALLAALIVPPAFAQLGKGPRKGMPNYDPATETTLKGTVEEVKEVECQMCRMGTTGTHLMVKSGSETLEVHLGPTAFLTEQKANFAKGDEIEVVGSKVKVNDSEALIAREVRKGEKTLTLRDAQGIPLWSRGRRSSY